MATWIGCVSAVTKLKQKNKQCHFTENADVYNLLIDKFGVTKPPAVLSHATDNVLNVAFPYKSYQENIGLQ
jgi:hypothetical protein